VLARAIVRDLYEGSRAARELSLMASIMALAPVAAPPIGGVLQTLFGWRSNFVFMVAVGVLATAVAWRLLPETLKRAGDAAMSLRAIGASYRIVAANRAFMAYLGILAFSFGGLFAWISGLTFVLQDLYAVTAFEFGIAFAFASLGYMTGTAIATHYVGRLGINRTIGLGATAQALGGLLAVVVVALRIPYAWPLVFAMALYVCGLGLVQPQAMAGALAPFPDRAGAASSLLGVGQMSFAAIVGAGVGQALGGSAWPLVLTVAVMGALTFATWVTTRTLRAQKA
jgi:DHA1 family bicyclomycin/chloramphenicol resistance-like MFS transporter